MAAVAVTELNTVPLDDSNKNLLGYQGARLINDGWKGDFVADATAAAFQYGLLVGQTCCLKIEPHSYSKLILNFAK
jgi:hypothetical protein